MYQRLSVLAAEEGLPSASADNLPVASRIAKEILCLPIYPDLKEESINIICKILKK